MDAHTRTGAHPGPRARLVQSLNSTVYNLLLIRAHQANIAAQERLRYCGY